MICFNYNDGGRLASGYKDESGDCVTRAISIATDKPYAEVYKALNDESKSERTGSRKRGKSSSRNGVYKHTFRKYLESIGWKWVPTMQIGSWCNTHLRADELPKGNLIVSVSKHLCAVIDGVLNDTHDCSRGGTRCVYGYFYKATGAA